MATLPPPAWYPDPAGRHQLRYWDGSAWTDYAADDGIQIMDPITPPAPSNVATQPRSRLRDRRAEKREAKLLRAAERAEQKAAQSAEKAKERLARREVRDGPQYEARIEPCVVRVKYLESHGHPAPAWDPADLSRGYAFTWNLPSMPEIGTRVVAPGANGLSPAIIVGFDTNHRGALQTIRRVASAEEIQRGATRYAEAQERQRREEEAWFRLARDAAGLPPRGPIPKSAPDRFPNIAPTEGTATTPKANEYGRMWWRAYKRAEEQGHPDDEVKRYRQLAHRWFAIRDKGK